MPIDVKVRLLDAPSFLDRDYDYSIPEPLAPHVHVGTFVTVPFGGGNRRHMALVSAIGPRDAQLGTVKPILSVPTPHISLDAEMMGLVCFLREQTLCTTGEAVHALLPAGTLSARRYFCPLYRRIWLIFSSALPVRSSVLTARLPPVTLSQVSLAPCGS